MNKDTEARARQAADRFLEGYNCTQAVFLTYCEELGLDAETGLRLASPFGGGMGRLREVCGTVSGMFLAAGLQFGYAGPKDLEGKKRLYAIVQELARRFENENGSIVCRELLGLDHKRDEPTPEARTPDYYKKRPCKDLAAAAVRIYDGLCADIAAGRWPAD